MTDIHVITSNNRSIYTDIMRDYHRARHDIFVGERKWMELRQPDGLEIDQYDNDDSIYLLALDGDRVIGGQRLYPTVLPHMITEAFPHLVDGRLPVGSHVLEWTRYFVIRERRRGFVDARLLAAVQQYCLEEGITDLTAVGEMWWLPRWHQYGFIVQPLGLPKIVGEQPALAVRISVSEETYETVLRTAGLPHADLIRHNIETPKKKRFADAA